MNIFRIFEILFDLLWYRVQNVWLEAAQATATLPPLPLSIHAEYVQLVEQHAHTCAMWHIVFYLWVVVGIPFILKPHVWPAFWTKVPIVETYYCYDSSEATTMYLRWR